MNYCTGALAKGNNPRGVKRTDVRPISGPVPGLISVVILFFPIQGHWRSIIHTQCGVSTGVALLRARPVPGSSEPSAVLIVFVFAVFRLRSGPLTQDD